MLVASQPVHNHPSSLLEACDLMGRLLPLRPLVGNRPTAVIGPSHQRTTTEAYRAPAGRPSCEHELYSFIFFYGVIGLS